MLVHIVIVWVRVVLKRAVVVGDSGFDNLNGSHLQSQKNSTLI